MTIPEASVTDDDWLWPMMTGYDRSQPVIW